MSDEQVVGSVGWSPDFKSKPESLSKKLLENIEFAPTLDGDGNIISINMVKKGTGVPGTGLISSEPAVPHQTATGPSCGRCGTVGRFSGLCKPCEQEVDNELLRDKLERLRDLVWKNVEVIDFTGFEDIREAIDEARSGG